MKPGGNDNRVLEALPQYASLSRPRNAWILGPSPLGQWDIGLDSVALVIQINPDARELPGIFTRTFCELPKGLNCGNMNSLLDKFLGFGFGIPLFGCPNLQHNIFDGHKPAIPALGNPKIK